MRSPWHLLASFALLALSPARPFPDGAEYCAVETDGAAVEIVRPGPDEPAIDDVSAERAPR